MKWLNTHVVSPKKSPEVAASGVNFWADCLFFYFFLLSNHLQNKP